MGVDYISRDLDVANVLAQANTECLPAVLDDQSRGFVMPAEIYCRELLHSYHMSHGFAEGALTLNIAGFHWFSLNDR